MLPDAMIAAMNDDLNEVEFVSRDVECLVKMMTDQAVGSVAR
jgi:hypothetical protein